MLTKSDISAIKTTVGEEVKKQIETAVKTTIQQELRPIRTDLKTLTSDVKTLQSDVKILTSDVKTLKSDVGKMRKDIDAILDYFDREYVDLRSRVERIEEHLSLPPLQ